MFFFFTLNADILIPLADDVTLPDKSQNKLKYSQFSP